ncbi:pectinesterase inhibitor [Argentina anserina]|uniref:pectinesterase inhibitor n=1 Tax=Argentina anserina TaxID=57926 RepID=UPI00217691D8|nr:pectinesterase inhibitor [Potentilla anserina]
MVVSSFSIVSVVLMPFLVLMSAIPSYAFTINKDICSNTKVLSRSFCSQFLGSNPVVIKSLLHSLAEATIYVASSNATSTSQQITKWQNQTNDPQLKNAMNQCLTPYNEAIADLKQAKEKLRSGDYVALERAAVDAAIKFHACDEKFEDTPPDTSPLGSTSSELTAISSILIAVFEILAKSYK